MKDSDSRSWIGGEGIPSRDHTSQGEERAEVVVGGFQRIEVRGKCSVVRVFCTCTWVSVETTTYVHRFTEAESHTSQKTCR
jgi:hypothetical protein